MDSVMANPAFRIVGSPHPTIEEIRAIPMFEDLDDADLSQISKGLTSRRVPRSEYLFRQGSDADSAFFVQSGTLSVVSALPGGGEVYLANAGPGSMLGEMSLVDTGVRTASVRAVTDVAGYVMERWFFQGALAHASPAATRILRRLIHIVCDRLRAQYAQLLPMASGSNSCVSCRNGTAFPPDLGRVATRSFPLHACLMRLGFFSNFQADEIRLFASQVRSLELPRNAVLYQKDERPASCFFVVRGALELCVVQGNGHVPVAVLGPGAFLGTTEIVSGGVRVACGRVREDAVILEINAETLRGYLSDQSCFAVKFQLAFCECLIGDLSRVNKRVARTTSQESAGMD